MNFDEMMATSGDFNPSLKWSAQAGELSVKTATGWEEVVLPAKFTVDLATASFGWREWVATADGNRPQDNSVRIGESLSGTKPADASPALFLTCHADKWVEGVEGLVDWVPTSITVNRSLQPMISKFRELSKEDQAQKAVECAIVGKLKVGKNDHRAPEVKFRIVDRPSAFLESTPAVQADGAGTESSPVPVAAKKAAAPEEDEWSAFDAA